MVTEQEIESTWELSKLLITNIGSYKLLLYKLPQYQLYLQSLRPILTVYKRSPGGPKLFYESNTPHIAAVRAVDESYVIDFIRKEKDLQAMKIFKHGMYFRNFSADCVGGLAKNTVKNMMGLKQGKIFRISSANKELRDLFYKNAIQINEEDNFGCEFDYDIYDYTLEIRPYKRFKDGNFHCWAVVTILYGDDMPNKYNMEITS